MSFRSPVYFILLCATVLVFGCKPQNKVKNEDILAEAGGKTLLRKDIPEKYRNFDASDSSGLLRQYIDRWVENQIMLQEAENYLSDKEKDKSGLIEDYRTSLLIFEYQKKLVREKLDTGVTESDIQTFYENNKSNFQLKKNIVKIRYVKIDKRNKNLNKVKQLMQSPNVVNDSLLRLLAEKEADNFYVDNNWLYLEDIMKEIPLDENYNQQRFLSNNKFITIEENGILYLLYILDYRIKNSDSPFEFEKDKIKDILLYQRKLDFLKSTQQKLVEKAMHSGDAKIYPNTK